MSEEKFTPLKVARVSSNGRCSLIYLPKEVEKQFKKGTKVLLKYDGERLLIELLR